VTRETRQRKAGVARARFLADGLTESELLGEYPQLVHEDVLAAIACGAEAARERIVPMPTDHAA
jgi:uncharacterized protein (DUF433 family)